MPDPNLSTTRFADYKRLRPPGIHRIMHGRCITLVDDTELAYIRVEGYTEYCRQIRLKDIQALMSRPTRVGAWINAILILLTIAFSGGALASANEPILLGIWLFAATIAALFLTLNALLGPTCTTHILTAAQPITLHEISRLHHATDLIERLRPRIAEAQGVAQYGPDTEPFPIDSAPQHHPTETTEPTLEPTVRDFT